MKWMLTRVKCLLLVTIVASSLPASLRAQDSPGGPIGGSSCMMCDSEDSTLCYVVDPGDFGGFGCSFSAPGFTGQ